MARSLPVILALLLVLPVQAGTKVGAWSEQASTAWWKKYDTPEEWSREAKSIHEQLLTIQERLGPAKVLANANFIRWVRHLKWLTLYPEDEAGHNFFKDLRSRRTFIALAQKPAVRDAFLGALSPYDDHPKALEIF